MNMDVDEHKFTELVREKMKEHPQYEEGMGVRITLNSPIPAGYEVYGGGKVIGIAAWARENVLQDYNLVISS